MSVCEHCGKELNSNAKFCEHCGAAASGIPTAQADIPPVSQAPQQSSYNIAPVQPVEPQQGSYSPPAQPAEPQQGSYSPPVQPVEPPQSNYQPPAGQATENYQPPAQPTAYPQSGSYQPPAPQAAQQQGSYQPPAQPDSYQAPAPPPTAQQYNNSPQPQQPQPTYQPPAGQATQHGGYQTSAPAQGGYQPQQTYAGQPTAVKQKKPINKKIFIFGGIGVAVIALIVILVILIGSRKDKEDATNPYVGVWNAVSVEIFGETTPADEVFDRLDFDFKANGKCDIHTDEGSENYKWEETKTEIHILSGSETIIVCIKDGDTLVVENFMDTGLGITFEKEGGMSTGGNSTGGRGTERPDVDIGGADSGNSVQEKWNGSWYGYFYIWDAYGEWAHLDEEIVDAYMVIDVDEDGNGTMAIFLEDNEGQTVDTYIFADENHFEVTEGEFWDCELTLSNWWLAISPVDEGNLIVISDIYTDPELTDGDGFEYVFYFRPWGELWTQEEKEVSEGEPGIKLPPGYDDYVAAIESGVTDPNAWDGGSSSSDDSGGTEAPTGADVEPAFTVTELKDRYEVLKAAYDSRELSEMTYEEVRDKYFMGIDGVLLYEEGAHARYVWYATDNDEAYLEVSFMDYGSGVKTASGLASYLP